MPVHGDEKMTPVCGQKVLGFRTQIMRWRKADRRRCRTIDTRSGRKASQNVNYQSDDGVSGACYIDEFQKSSVDVALTKTLALHRRIAIISGLPVVYDLVLRIR